MSSPIISRVVNSSGKSEFRVGDYLVVEGVDITLGVIILNGITVATTSNQGKLRTLIPSNVGSSVSVRVINPDQALSNAVTINVGLGCTIRTISPGKGIGGTTIGYLLGENFKSGSSVKFGSIEATVRRIDSSFIIFKIPEGISGSVAVTVEEPGGNISNAVNFNAIVATPVINSLSKTSLPAGESLLIKGANFSSNSAVKIASTKAFSDFISTQILSATVPLNLSPDLHSLEVVNSNLHSNFAKIKVTAPQAPVPTPNLSTNYTWKNTKIGGGGFVTGIVTHPALANLAYAWTDVGGTYRHNPNNNTWESMCDQFPQSQQNYYGGNGVAVDPTNANIAYMACGKYNAWGNGTIFKTTNGGITWTKLPIDLKMDSNDEERWAANRLAVCPYNSSFLLFASAHDGIWRSTDGGETWNQMGFHIGQTPTLTPKIGMTGVWFDPDYEDMAYSIAYGDGVYHSDSGGDFWTKKFNSPTQAQQLAIIDSSRILATHKSGIALCIDDEWSDVSPIAAHFNAIVVSPHNRNFVIAATGQSTNTKIFISTNAGDSWTEIPTNISNNISWWDNGMAYVWTSKLAFDYFSPNKVWMSNGFGVYVTNDITASPIVWTCHSNGIEETVAMDLICPSGILVSAVADVDGFRHDNGLDLAPSARLLGFVSDYSNRITLDIDYCESQPQYMVRVGKTWDNQYKVAKSSDGGTTWTAINSWYADKIPNRVAISAANPNIFLITSANNMTYRTTNGGTTWSVVASLPSSGQGASWNWNQFLAADRVDGNIFYFWNAGKIYKSNDAGATFNEVNPGLAYTSWNYKILKASPVTNEVWFSGGESGLFHSFDGGINFTKLTTVSKSHLFCFGPKLVNTDPFVLYLYGTVGGNTGIYRSRDRGATWDSIGSSSVPIGNEPNCMEADWANPGKVFVGTNGRGIYYGQAS